MKKFVFSLLTLFTATMSWADTALFIHQKSGGYVEYSFSEKPVVTYSEGYLIIAASGATSRVLYPLSNVMKFTFGEVDEHVTRVVAPVNTAPQPTYIYSIDGKLMRTFQPSEDGSTSASLEGLPGGTYVVKNGKTSYKVLKK